MIASTTTLRIERAVVAATTLVLAFGSPSASAAQRVHATGDIARAETLAATARAGVAPRRGTIGNRATLTHLTDTSETADADRAHPHRGEHALVGAVIGAAAGWVVGYAIDQRENAHVSPADPVKVYVGEFFLPPIGAIVGAFIGWHH